MGAQPDDKMLIGGDFTIVNSVTHNRLARLCANGSVVSAFNSEVDKQVGAIALQPNGKIVIGKFTTVGGTARTHVARLNTNDSPDTAFDPGSGAERGDDASGVRCGTPIGWQEADRRRLSNDGWCHTQSHRAAVG